jgi:hypothetical protein
MKNARLLIAVLFFGASATLSSCVKDCYSCTIGNNETVNLCKKDFSSTKEYNAQLKVVKTLGYNCK